MLTKLFMQVLNSINFYVLFRYVAWLTVLALVFKAFYRWRAYRRMFEELPCSKVRFYNLLGHNADVIKYFKYPVHFAAYFFIHVNGYIKLFGRDGVALLWNLTHPGVICYKAESVELILAHSTELRKAWFYRFLHPWLGDGLLTSQGSKWKDRRKFLTPAFHFNILQDFLPVMNKQAKIFVDVLRQHVDKEAIDIVPLITRCSFDIICETILGAEMNSQTVKDCDYLKSVIALSDLVMDRILRPWLYPDLIYAISSRGIKFRHHRNKVHNLAYELIAKKKNELLKKREKDEHEKETKKESQNDEGLGCRKRRALLDLLMEEHLKNASITDEEIREEVDTFMFEGHDTTSAALSWSLYLIGLYPEVQSKIHDELDSIFGTDTRDPTMDDLRNMKYLECAFKESLRLYPSVPGYGRELQENLEYKGMVIPKGSTCFVWVHTLHRDPEVFPNPEKFDPERFTPENSAGRHPFAYVPFSAGPRNCIGQRFALMEVKSVLSTILRSYKFKSTEPRDQKIELFEVIMRPFNGIRMKINSRK